MTLLVVAFVAFALVMAAMAVGVIFSDRRIKGSCGGLSSMSDRYGQPMCECGAKPGSCDDGDKKSTEMALMSR